jgi:hypothetical protein
MSRDQNAEWSYNMKTGNSSFESVENFRYLEKTLTDRNSIQKEIKSRLKSGNACHHSAQNRLFSSLLFKNMKFKIYRIKLCLLFCMDVQLGRLH